MNKEDKEILLKALCGRLPYEIKGRTAAGEVSPLIRRGQADYDIITSISIIIEKHGWKPYLFPLSSMTEKQEEEYRNTCACYIYWTEETFDWFNKNHFDYRGLIPMGLAEDGTGKNIY